MARRKKHSVRTEQTIESIETNIWGIRWKLKVNGDVEKAQLANITLNRLWLSTHTHTNCTHPKCRLRHAKPNIYRCRTAYTQMIEFLSDGRSEVVFVHAELAFYLQWKSISICLHMHTYSFTHSPAHSSSKPIPFRVNCANLMHKVCREPKKKNIRKVLYDERTHIECAVLTSIAFVAYSLFDSSSLSYLNFAHNRWGRSLLFSQQYRWLVAPHHPLAHGRTNIKRSKNCETEVERINPIVSHSVSQRALTRSQPPAHTHTHSYVCIPSTENDFHHLIFPLSYFIIFRISINVVIYIRRLQWYMYVHWKSAPVFAG